jgi:hypothetical protein
MAPARQLPVVSSGWWVGLCVLGVLGLAGYGRQVQQVQPGEAEPPSQTQLQVRVRRIDSWVEQREEALPTLRRLVATGDRRDQQDAVTALARLGADAAPARGELEQALGSPDVTVREMAIHSLAVLPIDRGAILARLSGFLTDPAREVRRAAARAVERAPDDVLREALQAGDARLPYLRLEQLRRLDTLTRGDVEFLRGLLQTRREDEFLRADCFELLIWHDELSLEDLYTALGSELLDLNALGLRYLETVGAQADRAAPYLLKMLDAPTAGTHMAALRGLALLEDQAREVLPSLEEYLHSERCVDVAATASLVTRLGGDRERAARLLRERLLGEVPGHAYAPTLLQIDPEMALGIVALLTARLDSGTGNPRDDLNNLRYFGEAAAPAVELARQFLADRQGAYRVDGAMVLEAVGPAAAPALPDLIAVVREGVELAGGADRGERPVERWALGTLRNLGVVGETAWPTLLERWSSLEPNPSPEDTGEGLEARVLEALAAVAPCEPEVQLCLRRVSLYGPQVLRPVACTGLLTCTPPQAEDLALARELVLNGDPSPRRGVLIDRLASHAAESAETIDVLMALAEGEGFPLGDRLLALESLGKLGAALSPWKPRLESLQQRPAGRFPGPSRVAVEGPIYADRYKPAVRQRLALRNWLRFALARLGQSEEKNQSQRLQQLQ